MSSNDFGNSSSSHDNGNKIDTSLFVRKPCLRSNFIEINIEEDIELRNQFEVKNLPDPISIREACNKNYVDKKFSDPSKINNTAQVDFSD